MFSSFGLSAVGKHDRHKKLKEKIHIFKICKLVTAFKAAKLFCLSEHYFSFSSFNKKYFSIPSVNFFIQNVLHEYGSTCKNV